MWFIQICKILKMCKNAKSTLFSLTQSYPFLWVIFYWCHFSSRLTWRKVTPGSFVRKKSDSSTAVGLLFYVDKSIPVIFLCGVIILLYTGAERKGSENGCVIFSVVFFFRFYLCLMSLNKVRTLFFSPNLFLMLM